MAQGVLGCAHACVRACMLVCKAKYISLYIYLVVTYTMCAMQALKRNTEKD